MINLVGFIGLLFLVTHVLFNPKALSGYADFEPATTTIQPRKVKIEFSDNARLKLNDLDYFIHVKNLIIFFGIVKSNIIRSLIFISIIRNREPITIL